MFSLFSVAKTGGGIYFVAVSLSTGQRFTGAVALVVSCSAVTAKTLCEKIRVENKTLVADKAVADLIRDSLDDLLTTKLTKDTKNLTLECRTFDSDEVSLHKTL